MYDFLEFIVNGLIAIIVVILLFIIVVGFIFGSYSAINYAEYKLDKSECNVYVDNNLVYSGRSHFISIDSIGENGNTKSLTIHKDVLCLKPDAHYVSENIKVEKK